MMLPQVCHNSAPSVGAASFAAIGLSGASTAFYSTPKLLFALRAAADGVLVQFSRGVRGPAEVLQVFAHSLNFTQECGNIISRHRTPSPPVSGLWG
jgi:hypothetical protein